jgi:hypothetical protein
MVGFISTSVTIYLNYNRYSAIIDLHTFQFTTAHTPGFSVSTSRLLAEELTHKNYNRLTELHTPNITNKVSVHSRTLATNY